MSIFESELPTKRLSFFNSLNDKINLAVNIGSVFLALESKWFSCQSLLNWLVDAPLSTHTKIAYKALCLNYPVNLQYLDDTYHFLSKRPEYLLIALTLESDIEVGELPDQNTPDCNNPIIAHGFDILSQNGISIEDKRILRLILTGDGPKNYVGSNLDLCCKARIFPHLNISGHKYNISLVNTDWTKKFRYNEKLASLILHRIVELQRTAPIYYAEVAYAAYYKVARKLNKDKLLISLSKDELIMFDTFFNNIVDKRILSYNNLAYKIAILGNDIAGYILGFPIQDVIPNDDQIHYALKRLTDLGPQSYAEYIKSYVKLTYTTTLPFADVNKDVIYSNETDVIMDAIDIYTPFDIVSCQIGQHMYRFTRPEFNDLVKNKKNPWTGEFLYPSNLSTIQSRVSAAKELGLPQPCPLIELLTKAENDTLFEDKQQEENVDLPSNIRRIFNILTTYGTYETEFSGDESNMMSLSEAEADDDIEIHSDAY